MAFSSPRAPALPLLFCVLGHGSSVAGFDFPIQLYLLCFVTQMMPQQTMLQIQLLRATLWDGLAVGQVWKTATLRSWAAGSHPKSWT